MFTEDLSPFFDTTNGFAVTGSIKKPDASELRSASVIFNSSLGPLPIFDAEIEAGSPYALIQTADLAGVIVGSHTIVIEAVKYRITKRTDDGSGVSTIWLKT